MKTPPLPSQVGYYRYLLAAALGETLNSWGHVEAALASLFCAAIGSPSHDISNAAFSAVHSAEMQLKMTDAAIQRAYKDDEQRRAAWRMLYKNSNKLRDVRNKLAHGQIIFVSGSGKGPTDVRFLPFFNYFTHKDRRTFIHYSQDEIENFGAEFSKLAKALRTYGKGIGAKDNLRDQSWSL